MAHKYNNGPDQVVPSDDIFTVKADGYVRLRIPESGKAIETITPISIPSLLKRSAEEFPDHTALAAKVNGKWEKITYQQYLVNVRTCAKAFLALGLERMHSVCILGFNSPEWFIADLGAIFAGGIAVGIYTTNSAEACLYCAKSSSANIMVVEDETQLQKVLSFRSEIPDLKAIVQYTGEPSHPDVISWKRLMEIGDQQTDDLLEESLKKIAVNQCCTLVYTSGTVGSPKAVMLNHDNFTWDALAISERLTIERGNEILISYLPLSHVAAQVVDIYITMTVGASVYFADKHALKGSLVNTMQEVQPTKFLAVPRVWEKIYEKMMQVASQNGYLKRSIATWAKAHALQYHINRIKGIKSNSWGYSLASVLIFKKIKQALGLNRCTFCASAAAPLSPDLKKYFLSIDIPIMDAFGMSEASGAHTVCIDGATNLDTIGMALPGTKSTLYNEQDGQGELCMYGRHIFMGYLNDPEKTAETLDSDGWLHTGDLGHIDETGFLYITGRLKELLITAGGENVPPVPIEQLVQIELPCISNAFLVGDRKKFLSILLTFKSEIDNETGAPLDTLTPSVQEWLIQLGCPATTVTEILNAGPDSRLLEALKKGIDRVNQQATSNAQRIQKLAVLPADFSVATGELGPTMKVKRRIVEQKYGDIIERLYN
ncbi:long-chain-fatty-acid--CoA ligase ACSBG2 [Anoplophora glabripennis]|nr:long-chain-fatty-acid--CoA ligase ACSBG2 [Anoplophora glabripennis]XP_018576090.1 long-chain-fatty-acid--CoA ligase ACSBG2 [Anoplophora glabripennis]XP_018576091.1 long-chain-fatty-acid--CoA ligase ACSBG2 [Anoplophora glabripennis]